MPPYTAETKAALAPATAASAVIPEDAAVPILLHPLVLLSVSDHVTRTDYLDYRSRARAAAGGSGSGELHTGHAPVMGVLLGLKAGDGGGSNSSTNNNAGGGAAGTSSGGAGAAVELVMSFEVVFKGSDTMDDLEDLRLPQPTDADLAAIATLASATGNTTATIGSQQLARQWYAAQVDWEAVREKREKLAEVSPEYEVVGWYTVGEALGDLAACASVHDNMCRLFGRANASSDNSTATAAAAAAGDDDDTAAAGRMLVLMVNPEPTGMGSAALPVHLYEAQLLHGKQAAGGASALVVALPQSSSHPAAGNDNEETTAAMTTAAVAFKPVRFQLESEEIEHIAMDAALNIELAAALQVQSQSQQQQHSGGGGGGGYATSRRGGNGGPFSTVLDGSLVTQAMHCGAAMRPGIARARRSLLLLRLRVALAAAYLDRVAAGGGGNEEEEQTAVVAAARGDWRGGPAGGVAGLTSADADALRQLGLAACQLSGTVPPTAAAAVHDHQREAGIEEPTVVASTSTTTTTAPTTALSRELGATLATALLALETQVAVSLAALARAHTDVAFHAHHQAAQLLEEDRVEEAEAAGRGGNSMSMGGPRGHGAPRHRERGGGGRRPRAGLGFD